MPEFDVIILGAGASGLYTAIHAARAGVRVAVIDHGTKTARKVRIAGGGKCNFTNLDLGPSNFLSNNSHFVKSALARHTPWDVVSFFCEHGAEYEERDHQQLFCTRSSGFMAGLLTDQAKKAGVTLLMNHRIERVSGIAPFAITSGGESITAPTLVMALGAPSWPTAGASDLAFTVARHYGLNVVPTKPGLVPLVLGGKERKICEHLTGSALPATTSIGKQRFTDALLFTHRGISGPAVLQISSYWNKGDRIVIDLLPGVDLKKELENHAASTQLRKHLGAFMPRKVAGAMLPTEIANMPINRLTPKIVQRVCERLHRWTVIPAGTEGNRKAEVTVGGIDTAHFSSKTMECRDVPGLYATGECLDVTGQLGGFNLHWAWASGMACATALAERFDSEKE